MSDSAIPITSEPQAMTPPPSAPPTGSTPRPPARAKARLPFWRNPRVWAVLLLLVGLVLIVRYGQRTLRSYREFEYAREQGLLDGTASVDAMRPWMTVRYIAVAYAVPEEYIYNELGIPYVDRPGPRGDSVGDLARLIAPNQDPKAGHDAVLTRLREIILAYRENPVAPGLRDVRPWMSIAYIANSTGVPIDYIFGQLTLPQTDNEYKPLDFLSEDQHYPGGPKALVDAVQAAVATYEEGQ